MCRSTLQSAVDARRWSCQRVAADAGDRQHAGQGFGTGISVEADAGDRAVCDDRGVGRAREDGAVLPHAGLAVDAARAGCSGGNPGWDAGPGVTLAGLMEGVQAEWKEQN